MCNSQKNVVNDYNSNNEPFDTKTEMDFFKATVMEEIIKCRKNIETVVALEDKSQYLLVKQITLTIEQPSEDYKSVHSFDVQNLSGQLLFTGDKGWAEKRYKLLLSDPPCNQQGIEEWMNRLDYLADAAKLPRTHRGGPRTKTTPRKRATASVSTPAPRKQDDGVRAELKRLKTATEGIISSLRKLQDQLDGVEHTTDDDDDDTVIIDEDGTAVAESPLKVGK